MPAARQADDIEASVSRRSRFVDLSPARHSPAARRRGLGPSATNEKILKNELAFAAPKRRATPATFNLVVWWRSRLGANKLVLCCAVRAVEAGCFEHGETITDLGELGQSAPQIRMKRRRGYGLWNGP